MADAQEALRWLNKLYPRLIKRREDIKKNLEYLAGDQKLVYATEEWAKFHKARFKDFSDNWCAVVANTPVRRLRIDGIRIGDDLDPLSSDERQLQKDWDGNELPTFSKQGFLMSVAAKRSFTLTWGDSDGNPITTFENPAEVIIGYDSTGRERRAMVKAWDDDDLEKECATVYLPDGVWKFQRNRGLQVNINGETQGGLYLPARTTISTAAWEPRNVAGEEWPLKNPIGEVPGAEWANRPLLGGEPLSDIAGTMAMQDAINLLWAYLFTAADSASMPARVILGAEPPQVPVLNSQGQVISTRPATADDLVRGKVLFVPPYATDARTPSMGQWDAANLDVFVKVVQEAIAHVAAQTSTPGHYLLSNEKFANLNADALTAAEVPLVDKVTEQQIAFTPAAKLTYRHMALVRGNKAMADEIRSAKIQWKDAAMHSVGQIADAATKDRTVGISLETVLARRYGFTPDEVQRELDRVKKEMQDPWLSVMAKDLAGQSQQQPEVTGGGVAGVGSTGA